MLMSVVEISKANGLLMASSAPLMERHLFTSITPRGSVLYNRGKREKERSEGADRGMNMFCNCYSNSILSPLLGISRCRMQYLFQRRLITD
jgi:hypothetical protein